MFTSPGRPVVPSSGSRPDFRAMSVEERRRYLRILEKAVLDGRERLHRDMDAILDYLGLPPITDEEIDAKLERQVEPEQLAYLKAAHARYQELHGPDAPARQNEGLRS